MTVCNKHSPSDVSNHACYVYCFCECSVNHRDLHVLTHSFPTRRASELTGAAITYARLAIELGRQQADPRFYGNAEAALSPWDGVAQAPLEIAWLRAVLHQQRHDFDGARAELDALLRREPDYPPALLTRAVINLVQGRPRDAQRDCAALKIGRAHV